MSLGNNGAIKDEETEANGDNLEELLSQSLALDTSRVTLTRLTNKMEKKDEKPIAEQDPSVNDIGGLLLDESSQSKGESVIWQFFRQG